MALKERRAAGESAAEGLFAEEPCAAAGPAIPGGEGAGQVADRRCGVRTAGLQGVAEEAESGRGWHSRPSFSAVSGGGEFLEPAGCDGGAAAPGRASPCRRPGFGEPLAWKRDASEPSGPPERRPPGWGQGREGAGIGGSRGGGTEAGRAGS